MPPCFRGNAKEFSCGEAIASQPVEALSEIALSFPGRTIAVCSVEIVFAPDDLVDRALEHHAANRNHYTRRKGYRP